MQRDWFYVVVFSGIGALYLYGSVVRNSFVTDFRPSIHRYYETTSSKQGLFELKRQLARISRVREVCGSSREVRELYGGESNRMYLSTKYNFTLCKVPKCGSTYWTQAFETLENGLDKAEEVFSKKRMAVHSLTDRFLAKKSANRSIAASAPYVLVSRDPYSRLFSAYVDKFYLPLMFGLHRRYVNTSDGNSNSLKCPVYISFQNFLDTVVRDDYYGKSLNDHWAPIVTLCKPCNPNAHLLVKQETFANDVEYVLKEFNVEGDKLGLLLDKLYGQRVESTMPGIVETAKRHITNNGALECLGYREAATRIWNSFKIQGFIHNNSQLPDDVDGETLWSNDTLSARIMEEVALRPMSRDDQSAQRRAALVEAYSRVDKKTLAKIQEVYKPDFNMFGYSENIPT